MQKKRKSPDEKLQELNQKKAQLESQIARERARVREAERKRDTRRKIVAGAVVLEHAQKDPEFRAQLDELLRRFVSRDQDRELFGIESKAERMSA
ncbi:hypothetical protein [Jiella marina]|uniref:hypothetical protein n=1 Tax=Jiella sp. LLJ827 TaxID=2917712 RepID=UPI0021013894|nr:hypothetical protein [Jiella sp. LLJ827]MCQ0990583.1 hypothetical protein [Jiella sp. LLJ827]